MTGCASDVLHFILHVSDLFANNFFVAPLAFDFRVTALQGEAGFLMIETNGIPILESVAFFARHRSIFSELSLVDIAVAFKTLDTPFGEFEIGISFRHFHRMAIPALCFQMSSFQLKRGITVIE